MREHVSHSLSIEPVSPGWRRAALQMFFRDLDPPEQDREIEHLLARLSASAEMGLLGVRDRSQLLGVVWTQMQAGRTATIWPPQLQQHDDELGRRLAVAAVELARRQGATLAQVQLAPDESQQRAWLEAANLRHIADMECLLWQAPTAGGEPKCPPLPAAGNPPEWTLMRYAHPAQRPLLEQMLQQTWIGTLDCPALEGSRIAADALEGYLAAGDSGAEHWFFLRHGVEETGCLLLAEHAADDEMELVYMGLAPRWRGRGLGHFLAQSAQHVTQRAGRKRLTTAVDSANAPARTVYHAAGFVVYDRLEVLVLQFV